MTIATEYTREWLQVDRPQPMYCKQINNFYSNIFKDINPIFIEKTLFNEFKNNYKKSLQSLKLNHLKGLDTFPYQDICIGVTQFIDNLYIRLGNQLVVFENDYKYHWRLNNSIKYVTLETLQPNQELIISMPFPFYGDIHPDMDAILDKCLDLQVPVHIDAAWLSCSRDIEFDFSHPAIHSFATSLSKGGLGANRIGCRWRKNYQEDSISLMNNFNMVPNSLVFIGNKFIEEFGPEYFWSKYKDAYFKICADFNLEPTKSIHLAKTRTGEPRGIRPLLRYLVES